LKSIAPRHQFSCVIWREIKLTGQLQASFLQYWLQPNALQMCVLLWFKMFKFKCGV